RQWYERQRREPELSDADRNHFARQDLRRGLGVLIMLTLAVGLVIGSRIHPFVAGQGNLMFVTVWLNMMGLIVVLFVLAIWDGLATRQYATRHRRSLARERIEMLREVLRDSESPETDYPPELEDRED